uniref:Uncharacterized protein n=1 Tax=viral metagenome TaxID=1070528 RepID=A0A6M3LXS0_9ZZZZ
MHEEFWWLDNPPLERFLEECEPRQWFETGFSLAGPHLGQLVIRGSIYGNCFIPTEGKTEFSQIPWSPQRITLPEFIPS